MFGAIFGSIIILSFMGMVAWWGYRFSSSCPTSFTDNYPQCAGGGNPQWSVSEIEKRVPRIVIGKQEFGIPGGGLATSGFDTTGVIGARGEKALWKALKEQGILDNPRVIAIWSAAKPFSGGNRAQGDIDLILVIDNKVFVVDAKLWKSQCVVRIANNAHLVLADKTSGAVVSVVHDVGNMDDACRRVYGWLHSLGWQNVEVCGRVVVLSEDGSTQIAGGCTVYGNIPIIGVDVFVHEILTMLTTTVGAVNVNVGVGLAQLAGEQSYAGFTIEH